MNDLLYKILKKPYAGRALVKIISKCSGGEMESLYLREYTKKRYNVDVGLYSYGGCFRSDFCFGGSVKIGRYCSIANKVSYIGFEHLMDILSTSPYFFENYYTKKYGIHVDDTSKYQELVIGNDVWIGMNVTILSKCHSIGNGAVIGAGSVVTGDIPPYAIAAGNPAKVIRYRFDSEIIERLEESKWWDHEPKELMMLFEKVHSPKEFVRILTL